jgi:phage protein D/phage baseplate assembly protein gpV
VADDFVPQLTVTIAGTELAADLYDRLTAVRAESSVQLPDLVTLTFVDEDFALYDRAFCSVGDPVVVSISSEGQPQTVADCDVTAIALQPGDDGGMTLVITAHGADHVLYRGVGLATFVDQTDAEIVTSIAGNAGLQSDVDDSTVRHPYVMQAATASIFLDQCAARVGYRWWVDGRTLHFKDTMPTDSGPVLTWGKDLIDLRMATSSVDATTDVEVRSWNPDTQSDVVGTAKPTSSLATIGTDAPGPTQVADNGRTLGKVSRFQSTRPSDDKSAADAMATGLARRTAWSAVNLRGCALGDPNLKAGTVIEIANTGTRLSGKYALAKVEHIYTASDGYVTRFETGGQDANGLVDLLRRPAMTGAWNPHTLVIGVVTNVSDPERPARVKVRFPTFSETEESSWARLVMPGAGPDRGFQMYPEIDDEVLVGFENGDPSRPVVLGGLWSKQNQPPVESSTVVESNSVKVRTWKSRSGHSITIRDDSSKDPDSVIVELADGTTRLTLAQDKVVLETPSDLTIKTDKNATFSAAGDLKLEGANVTIKATSKLTLEGVTTSAKGTSTFAIDGAKVDIKASAMATIDGGGMAQIKGGMLQWN